MTTGAARRADRFEGRELPSDNQFLTGLKLDLAYFSGRAWLAGREVGGAGAILRFERVRPRRAGRFQPLKSSEVTPGFLDRVIRALRRWKYDIVGIDEACRRAVIMPERRRFVCLTFDGSYKDLITSAYPVLSRHGVPFTVFVPTAFPDGVGEAWWLALEAIVARENRVSLMIDRAERHFTIRGISEKYTLNISKTGCARSRRRIFRRGSTISAGDTRSISRVCRARLRWIGPIWQSSPPILW
jgi:hypothetical protein